MFPDKKVIPSLVRTSGPVGFTRQSDVVRLIVEILARVRLERAHKRTDAQQRAKWEKPVRQLIRDLQDPELLGAPDSGTSERVYRVARWYLDHHRDDKYVPVVESASSLRDKFWNLERTMQERSPDLVVQETALDVLTEVLGSERAARFFEKSAVEPARGLRLTSSDADLARSLLALRDHVLKSRMGTGRFDERGSDQDGGPTSVVRRYVEWLGDQDWDATLRVLRPDSPAFASWRRDEAKLDPADRDPVTGASRWEGRE